MFAEIMWEAGFTASLIGVAGVHHGIRRRLRRAWRRMTRRDESDLDAKARELVAYSYVVEGRTPHDADAS